MQHPASTRLVWTATIAILIALAAAIWSGPDVTAGEPQAKREAGTIEILGSPDGVDPYVIVEAFPKLQLDRPVWIGHAPGLDGYLWVAEQGGLIKVFEDKRDVTKARVALDLRKVVARNHNEEGLLGMAFHPDFKKTKLLYVAYSSESPRRLVLSRFLASGTLRHIHANSEHVLVRQRQPHGNNNGGCIAFGPDGKLYLSVGDGGSHGDPDNHAQNLGSWLGTILRLDVSDPKKAVVPGDNPFVDVQNTKPEIWAYGLQNPGRFSFDRVTGALWAGDIGGGKFQEVNIIEKGGNYGWSLREGTEAAKPGRALVDLKRPLYALGKDKAQRITGGVVYRGKRLSGLLGAYVYGDAATGSVWALRSDGVAVSENRLLGSRTGITSFGEDHDGELYFTSLDGKIYTLAPFSGHKPKGRFPRRLSDTGLFSDMTALTPHPSLIEYDINVPLWSDGSKKQRFVMLPKMEKIKVDKRGTMEFPVGTIFVKHFWIGSDTPVPGSRLETRLFIRQQREWVGYTYVWSGDQKDAFLLDGRLDQKRNDITTEDGKPINWTFPSRTDCMACHTEAAGRVLGFRLEQINKFVGTGEAKQNQIDLFNRLEMFEGKVTPKAKAWPDWENTPKAKERVAVRAYLDVNCAMCHQPDGPGNALIDLRFDTPIKESNLVNRRPGQWNLDVYGAKLLVPGNPKKSLLYLRLGRTDNLGMPPMAHNVPDKAGMARVAKWIEGLK